MAFLAGAVRGAAGMARSGLMKGDSGLAQGSEDLKKVKKVLEDVKSGKISMGSLDGDMLKKLGGKGEIQKLINGEGEGLDKLGIKTGVKSTDVFRNSFNEKNGITKEKPKDGSDEFSSKSRIDGSLNVDKANFYDRNRLFHTKDIDPIPTYSPKRGFGEVSLEGGPLKGDGRKFVNDLEKGKDISKDLKELEENAKKLIEDAKQGLGKDFGEGFEKNLKDLEQNIGNLAKGIEGDGKELGKDLQNLEKNVDDLDKDIGKNEGNDGNEFSTEFRSFISKVKNVAKTVKDYEDLLGENTENLDDFELASDLANNPNTSNAGFSGYSRLSRNISLQNARKAVSKGGSPKSLTGGKDLTGGGSKSGQTGKTGSYDPVRGQKSEGWIKKTLDPVRNFYNKHEKAFDIADNLNSQVKQANDPTQVFVELMEKIAQDAGVEVPDEGGSQNNNANNNGNSLTDGILKSKGHEKGNKEKTASVASSERSSLGHSSNSKTSMVEHHTNSKTSTIERHPKSLKLDSKAHNPLKSNTHEKKSQRNIDFFEKEIDQTHHNPSKEGEIAQQKEGSHTQKNLEAEAILSEGEKDVNIREKGVKEFLEEVLLVKDVSEFLEKNDNKGKNEEDQAKIAEQQQRQVELESERVEVEEFVQANGRVVKQDGGEEVNQQEIKPKEEKKEQYIDKLDEMQTILKEWEDKWQIERTNEDQPAIQELPQLSQPNERELDKVKARSKEVREEQNENEAFQAQIKHSENFLDGTTVFERKSSYSNDMILQGDQRTGNVVEASVSKEAMLSSGSELSPRNSRVSLIEDKRGGTEKHSLSAEGVKKQEKHFNAEIDDRAGEKLETKIGDNVEHSPSAGAVDRRGGRVETKMGVSEEHSLSAEGVSNREEGLDAEATNSRGKRIEAKTGDEEKKNLSAEMVDHGEQKPSSRVETESLIARANPVSETSEIAVTKAVSETHGNPENDNTSALIKQVRKSEDKMVLEKTEYKANNEDKSQIEKQGYLQNDKGVQANESVENSKKLEEAKKLESDDTEALGREKDNFVSLFTSVAKPGLQTEIARKFGEDAYRDAKAGNENISELTRNITENLDKLIKDFTRYIQIEEKRIETEKNLDRRWQSETRAGAGVEVN